MDGTMDRQGHTGYSFGVLYIGHCITLCDYRFVLALCIGGEQYRDFVIMVFMGRLFYE